MTTWKTISRAVQLEITKRKGSRFISAAWPLASEDNSTVSKLIAQFIEIQRCKFPAANHHCYAYTTMNGCELCSDDREPYGTAGRPILAAIQRAQLVDVCVVVTRIFGGVKLGSGGLIRAYGAAAQEVIEQAEIVEKVPTRLLHVQTAYLFVISSNERVTNLMLSLYRKNMLKKRRLRSVSLSTRVTNLSAFSGPNQQDALK